VTSIRGSRLIQRGVSSVRAKKFAHVVLRHAGVGSLTPAGDRVLLPWRVARSSESLRNAVAAVLPGAMLMSLRHSSQSRQCSWSRLSALIRSRVVSADVTVVASVAGVDQGAANARILSDSLERHNAMATKLRSPAWRRDPTPACRRYVREFLRAHGRYPTLDSRGLLSTSQPQCAPYRWPL